MTNSLKYERHPSAGLCPAGPAEEGGALCRAGVVAELRTVPCLPLWEADLRRGSLLGVSLSSNPISLPSYLASDMEEDNQAPKQDIFAFLYGKDHSQRPLFHKLRYQFLCSMRWRTWVSPEEMEEVGTKPSSRKSFQIGGDTWAGAEDVLAATAMDQPGPGSPDFTDNQGYVSYTRENG
ncbi:Speedy protein E4 [Plecturocebus cupreus]